MRISDWSSDVCSSDLLDAHRDRAARGHVGPDTTEGLARRLQRLAMFEPIGLGRGIEFELHPPGAILEPGDVDQHRRALARGTSSRSEEHTSELQSLMRISYAVFCLKQKKNTHTQRTIRQIQKTYN